MRDSSKKIDMKVDPFTYLPDHIINHILSCMDTKYAVQTCVFSTKWEKQWTHIHSLNFDSNSFVKMKTFRNFVLNVLSQRDSSDLFRLKFYNRRHVDGKQNVSNMNRIFSYAKTHNVDELETDVGMFPPSLCECQTLTTLKLQPDIIPGLTPSLGFSSLTTLYLSTVFGGTHVISNLIPNCLNLENLFLVGCWIHCDTDMLNISASRLVNLTISDFGFYNTNKCIKVVIFSPRLKFFNYNGVYPQLFAIDKYSHHCRVDIQLSPHIGQRLNYSKKKYISELISMVEGLSAANVLTISLKLLKEKFVLHYNALGAEKNIIDCNKGIEDELWAGMIKVGKVLGGNGFTLKYYRQL